MTIELFHRGRFQVLKTAKIQSKTKNAYSISIGIEELKDMLRQPIEIDVLDGHLFIVEEQETEHVVGHRMTKHALHVTVWVL